MRSPEYKYSVIIPHKNRFDLLSKLLSSIPQRDDIEILIVDDASDSEIKEKLETLVQDNSYLKLFRNETNRSKGAGWARNVGINHANGEYLIFADSDDLFTVDAFKVFDNAISEGSNDLIIFKASSVDEEGRKSHRTEFRNFLIEKALKTKKNIPATAKEILSKIDTPWAKLIRRDLVLKHDITFDEIRYSNDVMFNLRFLTHAQEIEVYPENVYVVLEHSSSLIKVQSKNMLEQRFDACIRSNKTLSRQSFIGNSYSVTGGYIWQAKKYGLSVMLSFIKRSWKNKVRVLYPLHRYLIALFMKLRGEDPLKIRFYVVFGYKP